MKISNVELTDLAKTVTEDDDWSYKFENLPKYKNGGTEIVYTIDEANVPEGYSKSVSGYNITNKHTPETTSVAGTKNWDDADNQDGKRPTSITVKLLADGVEYKTTTTDAKANWKYSFTDLPVYKSGEKIVYTIDEVNVPYYTTTYSGYDITNKYTPEVTTVTVEKYGMTITIVTILDQLV